MKIDGVVMHRAKTLSKAGFGLFDALQTAAAEAALVDVFLTTDDRLIKLAARPNSMAYVPVRNPLSWVKEQQI